MSKGRARWDERHGVLPRRRLEEIIELAEADPLYGISQKEAMRRAAARVAEKYGRSAGARKGGKQ